MNASTGLVRTPVVSMPFSRTTKKYAGSSGISPAAANSSGFTPGSGFSVSKSSAPRSGNDATTRAAKPSPGRCGRRISTRSTPAVRIFGS